MRIALLHYTLPPVIGGVERVIRDQAAALRLLGHDVEMFDRSADALVRFRKLLESGRPRPQESQSRKDPEKSRSSRSFSGLPPFKRVRQWMDREDAHPYFQPDREITKHRNGLSHWQQGGKLFFVTWRLADALPQSRLEELRSAKAAWELKNPRPWNLEKKEEFQNLFDLQIETWLAAGIGDCVLRQPETREPLIRTFHHDDGTAYDLLSYVIMPNHIHVLFRLKAGAVLEEVIQAWKSISSRRIGRILGRSGEIWQAGYHDRMIRGPEHLQEILKYIERNPCEAGLMTKESEWWETGRPAEVLPTLMRCDLVGDEEGRRGRRHSVNGADEGVGTPVDAVIVHNVFTMPFDLAWTRELREMAETLPEIRWINWMHDVAAVNPYYAHLPWQQEDHRMLSLPVPNAINVTVSEVRRQDYMRASGLTVDQIHVIPNGLDFASVLGLTGRVAALRLWDRELVLVHPTRLIRRKNIELGVRVTGALKAAGVDVLYIITGAPDPHQTDGRVYYDELRALVDELDLASHVLFMGTTGPVSDEDVHSLYMAADALFFPSTGEGFGLPLLEAQTHRLTIFCSNLPVHHEVLANEGLYFEVDAKPEEISARIVQWLQTTFVNHQRRHLWRRHDMVKICQEHLEPLLTTANQSS